MATRAAASSSILAEFGVEIPLDVPVSRLSASERTIIAIGRALQDWDASRGLLVLDEATAALDGQEVDQLFGAVRTVTARGAAVVFVSHRTPEVLALADRCGVLREGRLVDVIDRAELSHDRLFLSSPAGSSTMNTSALLPPGGRHSWEWRP